MRTFEHFSRLPQIQHGIFGKEEVPPQEWFPLIRGEQVHKDRSVWVDAKASSNKPLRGVDALMTKETACTLSVLCADCVPVLFVEPRARIVGAIHAGWRGTALDITRKTIESLGLRPFQLLVGIGPAICPECFEVGEEVARQFLPSVVQESEKEEGKFHVDLWQANVEQCLEIGVPERNIEVMRVCTVEHDDLYSFRRGDREQRNIACIRRV